MCVSVCACVFLSFQAGDFVGSGFLLAFIVARNTGEEIEENQHSDFLKGCHNCDFKGNY